VDVLLILSFLVLINLDALPVEIANTPIVSPDPYHPPLFICFPIPSPITSQDTHTYRDYKSADYESMNHYLESFDWENTFSLYLVMILLLSLSSINKFVPNKVWSPSKFPKWTSRFLKDLITNKNKVHAIYKRTKSISDYLVFF